MRAIAVLAAAAMVIALFLPWSGDTMLDLKFAPWELVRQINSDSDTLRRVFGSFSLGSACFLATFILAVAFIVLSIIGFPSRIIAIIAGGSAITLIGYNIWQSRQSVPEFPLLQSGDFTELANEAQRMIGIGAWIWGISAFILLVAGLIGFRRH